MMEKLRWFIAYKLDDLFEDVCWYKLSMWAMGLDDACFWDILKMRHTAGICAENGKSHNLCGKCNVTRYGRERVLVYALRAAVAGIEYAVEHYTSSPSAEAEIAAFINGCVGPDVYQILDKYEEETR